MNKFLQKFKFYYYTLKEVSNKVSSNSGKRKFGLMIDIFWCTILYGASPNNYMYFDFYKLKHDKRKSYVTHRVSENIIKKYNDDRFRNIFEDKTLFAEKFNDYFGRQWVNFSNLNLNDFIKFIEGKNKIIFKPVDSAQGQGIEVIKIGEFQDYEKIYNYLIKKHGTKGLIEDWIQQHTEISNLYSKSVNPIRIITVLQDGKCIFLVAGLTIGNGNEISNASCNDMVAPIDIDTGVIKMPGADFKKSYQVHPETGKTISGLKIPYWEETINLIEKASKLIPEVGYIGWDVAITPIGPILIEGNTSPGYKFYQIPFHMNEQVGMKPAYQVFL